MAILIHPVNFILGALTQSQLDCSGCFRRRFIYLPNMLKYCSSCRGLVRTAVSIDTVGMETQLLMLPVRGTMVRPLLRWPAGTVVVNWSVPVLVAIPKPLGRHWW